MDKAIIKVKLREGIMGLATEKTSKPINQPQQQKSSKRQDNKTYAEIQRALADGSMLKKSQVMAAAGLGDPDDAGDRRAFNAKVDQEPNEEGSIRQFDDNDLAKVAKVVSNPKSYLDKINFHSK